MTPIFYKRVLFFAHFNAGVRAVDIRDPFHPKEIGYYIPAMTENTSRDAACKVAAAVSERCKARDPDQQRRSRRPRLHLHRRSRQHRHAHPRAHRARRGPSPTGVRRRGSSTPQLGALERVKTARQSSPTLECTSGNSYRLATLLHRLHCRRSAHRSRHSKGEHAICQHGQAAHERSTI